MYFYYFSVLFLFSALLFENNFLKNNSYLCLCLLVGANKGKTKYWNIHMFNDQLSLNSYGRKANLIFWKL